jgi:hypothetical protein
VTRLLNSGMSGGQAVDGYDPDDQDQDTSLSQGESYCSPQEEELLKRVMAAVYRNLNTPSSMRALRASFQKYPQELGVLIGNTAFNMLFGIYRDAKKAGAVLPVTVFLAQGGAIYQTIDILINMAEHFGVNVNADQCREDAMGFVLDQVKSNYGLITGGQQPQGAQQTPQAQGAQPPPGQNPLSGAVSQGLASRGLLGGQ